ncbi:MAG TPA: hypothetical protein VMU16_15010 [Candidatus Binataceae bacterium]|nr:hypothetical protein [Candidatus Binataceae bacterium]
MAIALHNSKYMPYRDRPTPEQTEGIVCHFGAVLGYPIHIMAAVFPNCRRHSRMRLDLAAAVNNLPLHGRFDLAVGATIFPSALILPIKGGTV